MRNRLVQQLQPQVSVEPELEPEVRFDLEAGVELYVDAQYRITAGEEDKAHAKFLLDSALEDGGLVKAEVAGHIVQWVFPTVTRLDEKKLLALGVPMALIEAAKVTTPGKPYISVKAKKVV